MVKARSSMGTDVPEECEIYKVSPMKLSSAEEECPSEMARSRLQIKP
jgi:hypothetical protein